EGNVAIQYNDPESVVSRLAPTRAELAQGNEVMRLQLTYAHSADRVSSADTLPADLPIARSLSDGPATRRAWRARDAVAAGAAAAVVAQARGRATVSNDDVCWAADVLIDAASPPDVDEFASESAIFPWGADRSAAVGLPALLLPTFDGMQLDRDAIGRALHEC